MKLTKDRAISLYYKAPTKYKEEIRSDIKETITLTNGVKVRNFSSPHPFSFTDGSILPAHTPEMSEKFKVDFIEEKEYITSKYTQHTWIDVQLSFELSKDVVVLLTEHINDWLNGEYDILIVPLPLLNAYKQVFTSTYTTDIKNSPLRTCRIEDRVHKICSINKFSY